MTAKTLRRMTDRELEARRAQLAIDVRSDPDLRDDLEAAEEELARRIARRSVAADREAARAREERRREVAGMTDAELERERVRLGALAPSEGREEHALVHEELRRREERRTVAARAGLPPIERRVVELAGAWEEALDVLVERTRELSSAIGVRSNARSASYGTPPSWGRDLERVRERCAAVVSAATGQRIGEPGWSRVRQTPLTGLI